MRKFTIGLLVIALAQALALGGLVTFSPEVAWVDLSAGDGTLVKYDVLVSDLGAVGDAFQSVDILFGSDTLDLVDLVIDPGVGFGFSNVDIYPNFGIYANELLTGGFAFSPVSAVEPRLLGSLIVDVAGLGPENHYIIVDGFNDGDRSVAVNGARDILVGSAWVGTPEPTTLSLLGLVSLVLIRRCRQV